MHFAYIGNFAPPFSTENLILEALRNNGHQVTMLMERPWEWANMDHKVLGCHPDVVLWTSTNDYAPPETFGAQRRMLQACHDAWIPVVGYHLDLWFGISRAHLVDEKPFFEVDMLCTADGGHDEEWAKRGINHAFFPPAVLRSACQKGTFQERFASDIAFVGGWQSYHHESIHRFQLIAWLEKNYGPQFRKWPELGQERIDGPALADLYASTKVVVGDSCMVPHLRRYWSDRIPATTGRGGFLLHPHVEGLAAQHPHLVTWHADSWGQLEGVIEAALKDEVECERIARLCRDETMLNHTYERRMEQLVDLMTKEGLL